MPIYEYRCNACNYEFEKIVSNSQIEILCPKCEKDCTKLMSAMVVANNSFKQKQLPSSPCQSCASPYKDRCQNK